MTEPSDDKPATKEDKKAARKAAREAPTQIISGKSIETILAETQKKFGPESLMRLTNEKRVVPHISSGSYSLDDALGCGGYPRGRIIEIYGQEASGKTTLTLHAIAECQRVGGVAAFIDAEHAFDKAYAQTIGVDTGSLLFCQPDNGEQGLQIADELISSGNVAMVVIDSVAALVPKSEIDGEVGDFHVGEHARMMSQTLRMMTPRVAKSGCVLIFINQIRQKIGVMFGNPNTTTGGNALKFFTSVRMEVAKIETLKHGDDGYGIRSRVKVVKNKLAPPFQAAELDIVWGEGIDRNNDLLSIALTKKLVGKAGAWFDFAGRRFQGFQNFVDALDTDSELCAALEAAVLAPEPTLVIDADGVVQK